MSEPDIASIAAAIGEPARAKMLTALMSGKALTASELALEAEITAQTASTHLHKLVTQQLITVDKQGRHKYFRLLNAKVSQLLEALLVFANQTENKRIQTGPKNPELRYSRICYDHLAGEIAVKLYDRLNQQLYIDHFQQNLVLTESGKHFFAGLGADVDKLLVKKRPLCRSCLDWSERRYHLAGSLGKWLLDDLLSKGWVTKDMDSRVIRFSKNGFNRFSKNYDIK